MQKENKRILKHFYFPQRRNESNKQRMKTFQIPFRPDTNAQRIAKKKLQISFIYQKGFEAFVQNEL